jgi:hypothetical protein
MYNTDMPSRAELPSSTQLLRSTAIAISAAIAILVTIVLPSEYGIDPTGIGRILGLVEMGEIKTQLSEEAEADRKKALRKVKPAKPAQESSLIGTIFANLLISSANASETEKEAVEEISVTLESGEWVEVKLVMDEDGEVKYSWSVIGGVVKFDLHGESDDEDTSYKKGRGADGDDGSFTAEFDGEHGWYWRNRGDEPVTITLRISGEYTEIKRYS